MGVNLNMKKLLCSIIIFIFIFNEFQLTTYATPIDWPQYPEIYAETGVLIEASTGAVIYNKNMNQKMYPASITKILTSLIAIENSTMDEMVTFSHDSVFSLSYDDAHIGMMEGEMLSMEDCLYGVLLASANEVANAVGEHVGGTIDGFADLMNERAKEAGALNSNFENPSGLFNENHYTTCYDMAMITRAAIKSQKFLEIEKNTTYSIPSTNLTTEPRYFGNRHKMLFPNNPVYYDGILGGKTGYVDQSGNTLVTFARRNGMTLISVVMKSDSSNVYADTTKLLDYGFNNFELQNISENETAFSFGGSSDSSYFSVFGEQVSLITINTTDSIVIPKSVSFSDVTSKIEFVKNSKDNTIANLNYYYQDNYIGKTSLQYNSFYSQHMKYSPLIGDNDQAESKRALSININIWLVIAVVIILIILFIFIKYYKMSTIIKKRKRLNKRKYVNKKIRF